MSLPIPSTSSVPLDTKQLQALDAPLIALTQQCGGDLRGLMFAFFSFLHRRTDFYLVPHPEDIRQGNAAKMGFKEGDAEKLLLASFRQFPLRRIPKTRSTQTNDASKSTESTDSTPDQAPKTAVEEENGRDMSEKKAMKATTSKSEKKNENELIGNMEGVQYNEEGLQIPVGNGGSTKLYKWTQTIDECSVLIGIPEGLRGKDLDVKITSTSLSVKSKKPLPEGNAPFTFVEGKLVEKIRADESTWSVEGGVVIATLDKVKKTFWATVIDGDEKIDTELVDNRRHIGEYDDVTQAQIRKCIFDQQQYHKGLPSSDEILKKKSVIPPLPPGVEYIDKAKVDDEEKKKKSSSS